MKALVFMIAITIGFTSLSFAQNCGITEAEAQTENSHTWNILKARFELEGKPKHWQHKKANYWINILSNEAPTGAEGAIKQAANRWNSSTWQGQSDFTFKFQSKLGNWGNRKDNKNMVVFQRYDPGDGLEYAGVTFIVATQRWPRRDRLKEVDTIINTKYYWAVGALPNKFDVESVMAHEFGHWPPFATFVSWQC